MENFKKLGLSKDILGLLQKSGLENPTEIQEKAIPLVLAGKDVIGGSYTGSGKTLAFGTGIIEKTQPRRGLQALILTPTRELAEQIGKVLKTFSHYKKLHVAVVYGGVAMGPQVSALKDAEVVVATPGRILDHMQRKSVDFSYLKILVLDEADRMLDMGFIQDVEKIISQTPKDRQTLLFSATISSDIEHIAKKHMRNPENVFVQSYVDPTKLKQIFYDVPKEVKFSLLVHLLKQEREGLVMVFCNTRHNTDFVAENLKRLGIHTLPIHGGLTQGKRNQIMEMFHGKEVYVLVCTDIAARGLDIKGVSHVYNYDIPATSKDYIHRIGRTARAGKEGIAINLVSERDYENFNEVLRDESLKIDEEKLPEIERVAIKVSGFQRQNRRSSPYRDQRHERRAPGRNNYRDRNEERSSDRYGGERKIYGHRWEGGHKRNVASHQSYGRNERGYGDRQQKRFGRRDDFQHGKRRRPFNQRRRY
ncbi:DEAD/DEAH box helicase [Candidatus Pacearchaeota archaeon]|nr:DEAD/DEAH box helicase [Candidatus Pacearchaeota archaeon]